MILIRVGRVGTAAAFALLLALNGCQHEVLTVPPRSEMLGSIPIHRVYALQQKTEMDPLRGTDAQPQIDLRYWNLDLPPAEAFERVPFSIVAPAGAYSPSWSPVTLEVGTQISFADAEVYKNSRVYIGRILTGGSRNVHMLLVVPIAKDMLPTAEELEAEDKAYIVPINTPTTRPTTQPSK